MANAWSRKCVYLYRFRCGLAQRKHSSTGLPILALALYSERPHAITTMQHRTLLAYLLARNNVLVGIIRDPPPAQAGLVTPFRARFRLPGPKYPALRRIFVHLGLGVVVLSEELLVLVCKVGARARLASARADGREARVGTVVARADAAAVQVLGAIGRCERPLADDGVERRCRVVVIFGADALYSLAPRGRQCVG